VLCDDAAFAAINRRDRYVPVAGIDIASFATPLLSVMMPSDFVPSRKVTLPDGMLGAGDLTVAVKVTACPWLDGFRFELIAFEVLYFEKLHRLLPYSRQSCRRQHSSP
jgi:hypothetical protein